MVDRVVVPGEVIARGKKLKGENLVQAEKEVIATRLGILQSGGGRADVIPYSGPYKPKKGEVVIGVVTGYAPNGWIVDIGSGGKAFLPAVELFKGKFDPRTHELREKLKIGDVIVAKVAETTRSGSTLLTLKDKKSKLGRLDTPWFIKVPVVKIARIIGKKGSMLSLIEKASGAKIIVGQNGVLGIEGSYESFLKVREAVELISEKTFSKGLTDKVSKLLGVGGVGGAEGRVEKS